MTSETESAHVDAAVNSTLVGALFDAWAELELVIAGLSAAEMVEPWFGGSAFGWTCGHVANSVDAWLNVRFQGRSPHPLIGEQHFRFGGDGRAADWPEIARGVAEVYSATHRFLAPLHEVELDVVIPYGGSIVVLHESGLSLRHAVTVNLIHCHYHIGEIATKRGMLGHHVPHLSGPRQRLVSK